MSRNKRERTRPTGTSELAGLAAQPEPVLVGDQVHAANTATSAASESDSSELPNSETSGVPDSESAEVSNSGTSEVPKFQALERKDTRLRPDQVEELRRLAKRLSQARTDRSERITENTLIRVALDMLFARSEALRGNNEDELRQSGTAGVRKSRGYSQS